MTDPHKFSGDIESISRTKAQLVEIDDPVEVGKSEELIAQDVVSLDSGTYWMQRVTVPLEEFILLYQSTRNRNRVTTKVKIDSYCFVAVANEAKGRLGGVPLLPNSLIAAEPGAQDEFVVEPGYESVTVFLPSKLFKERVGLYWPGREFQFPIGAEVWSGETESIRSYFDVCKKAAVAAALDDSTFDNNAEARASAHNEILEALIAAIATSTRTTPVRHDLTSQNYNKIVKTCETLILERGSERLHVRELCNVSGTSERTLQYAFQEITGMSPMSFVKQIRLHRTRDELKSLIGASARVTEIALKWGFWNLGEFARDYQQRFGELPSQTLKRGIVRGD